MEGVRVRGGKDGGKEVIASALVVAADIIADVPAAAAAAVDVPVGRTGMIPAPSEVQPVDASG